MLLDFKGLAHLSSWNSISLESSAEGLLPEHKARTLGFQITLYLLCHPQTLLLHALLDFQVLSPFSGISLTNHHKSFLALEGTRMSGVAESHPFSSRAQVATFAKLETWGT